MPQLAHGDAQDLLDAVKRGWETRDPDVIVGLFAKDAEYREDPFAEPLVGHNAIRARWNRLSSDRVHVEFDAERIYLSGNTVLASWHGAYTRRQTAERVRVRGFMTLELDAEGLVHRFRGWPAERVVGVDETARPEMEMAHGG